MKKEHMVAILLFSGVWGAVEAVLGDALYSASVPQASVFLTVIGFFILAVSRAFVPWTGAATLIAAGAMLYKLLNVPFFACHLAGISLLGVAWDLAWGVARVRRPIVAATLSVYLGHLFFLVAMTAVFRSDYWIEQGLRGWVNHLGVSATLTAIGCALLVPLGLRNGERLRRAPSVPATALARLAPLGSVVLTIGLWAYAVGVKLR
jgi:hypothetical protein